VDVSALYEDYGGKNAGEAAECRKACPIIYCRPDSETIPWHRNGRGHAQVPAGIMPGDESSSWLFAAGVWHVCAGVSALQHDFAGDCIQSILGIFPGVAGCGIVSDDPDQGQDKPTGPDKGSDALRRGANPSPEFLGEARTGSVEDRSVGLTGTLLAGSQVMKLVMQGILAFGDRTLGFLLSAGLCS
jgi:hypothetical protein